MKEKKLFSIITALIMMLSFITYIPIEAIAADNEQIIFEYLTRQLGFNSASASGILANIGEESSFDPNKNESVSGAGYGLCQWTGSRRTALMNWCGDNGYDYTSIEGQLNYLNHELQNGYSSVYNTLISVPNTADGAYNAAYAWCMDFEKPEYRNKVHGQYDAYGNSVTNGGYDKFNAYGGRVYKCLSAKIGMTESEYRGYIAKTQYWVKHGDKSVPTWSSLVADKYTAKINEDITFSASSDYATGFTIGVDNSNGRYLTQEMPGGKLTISFSEAGSYGAYVTSYNSLGYCDSAWISFSIYDTKPNTSKLEADKTIISVGDSINFTASSDDPVKGYTIGVDNAEGRYITQEMPDGKLTLTFDNPGQYGAYVTSYNDFGYSDSQWITFTVFDTKPSTSFLFADKDIAYVGQEITFNASSDIATGFTIGVDNETGRLITQEMPNGSLTLSFSEPGQYSAYVTSYNRIGYADSERIFFTVYNTPPTISELSASTNKVVINEPISFFAKSDLANGFYIGIDTNNERYLTEQMPDGCFTTTFAKPGKYYAYVTSSNGYGYVDSKWITFTVYASEEEMIYNGDCNGDGEFNVSDVVLLQKWLLAVPDTHFEDWKAANLCKDDRLDVFDLCLMKRKLIYG